MKKANLLVWTFFCCAFAVQSFAQAAFTNCTAAFLDNKIVVDEYSPRGKCTLSQQATGELTVCTANLSPSSSIPVDKIKFKIAIKDKNTGTVVMFSDATYKKVAIQKVLERCKQGDRIILITMDDEYALPHNEILVQE